ncbi:alcohol dehydrogenase catalytic domain-containing protein [Streptomyces celluloflavus]|uniref:alcohol dehydrogenase catalytic domain-containing protein n=1 Tax=Streptomyces celluloflavus TaxID=58344 RepID=UPI0037B5E895
MTPDRQGAKAYRTVGGGGFERARHRPLGAVRHAARVARTGGAAARIGLERGGGARVRRLAGAAEDRVRQRLRPTRARMRALVARPGGQLVWQDVPVPPPPGPDGALVHPIAVATCDVDRPLALGTVPFPLPLHFGHECVAEVLEVGEAVTSVRPGQRVVVPFQISCGACPSCRAGRTANCTGTPPLSMYGFGLAAGHWGGAYSDQLAVPYADAMLVPLPDALDPAAAASVADTVCDGYRHVAPHLPALLARDPDTRVTVLGALGPGSAFGASCPLYAALTAKALGARHIVFADSRPAVRAQADALGLEGVRPNTLRVRPSSPLVVDVSVDARGLALCLSRTAPDGVCSSGGSFAGTARIPQLQMYGHNATLHVGRTHARALIPGVLALMADGRLRPQDVITELSALDDAPRTLGRHIRGDATKTVLTV